MCHIILITFTFGQTTGTVDGFSFQIFTFIRFDHGILFPIKFKTFGIAALDTFATGAGTLKESNIKKTKIISTDHSNETRIELDLN